MQKGFFVEDIDFLQIEYRAEPEIAKQLLSNKFPLIFTSQHAVKAVSLLQHTFDFTVNSHSCYCIKGATSSAAISAGFNLKGLARNAADLAEIIIEKKERSVFHCTTSQRRRELYQVSEKAGVQIIACEVYQKKQLEKKVGKFDGIMFFSPSQFDAFTATNELDPNIPVFCIGRTTATHAAKFNHKNIIVSKQASEEAILKSVYNYFKKL